MTIYVPAWLEAWERAHAAPLDVRPLLVGLMEHLEAGWKHLRPLEWWFEEHRDSARGADEYWHLMEFLDGDLVDVFRGVVADAAALVPGYPEWADVADPGDVDGEADTFHRYLVIAGLAAEHHAVPEGLRSIVRAASLALADWVTELGVLVDAINTKVVAPAQRHE